jgi:hypothetical protein
MHQLDWKYIRQGDRCEWKYIWPAFYWNLLTGVDVRYNKMFCETYPAEHLWKMVPDGIRPYWRGVLSKVEEYSGVVGDDCEETQSHFKDITRSVDVFWTNIRKYTFEGMMKALDPERAATGSDDEHMVLPNVLCPWGCCEFPFRTASLNPALLLQHHLPKVQLNLPSALLCQLHTVESSRLDYIRKPNEQLDYVLLNPKWPICASVRMTWQGGLVICTCRHHDDTKKRSYLYSHVPRKPDGFNLSSVHTDELAHAVMKSCVARPVCKKGMNTTPSLHVFRSDYAGCDSGDVIDGVGARFGNNGIRFMNFIHESESLNREDIKELCAFYLKQGLITQKTIDKVRPTRCG